MNLTSGGRSGLAWLVCVCDVVYLVVLGWLLAICMASATTMVHMADVLDTSWILSLAIMYAPTIVCLFFLALYSFSLNAQLSTNRRSIARRAGR